MSRPDQQLPKSRVNISLDVNTAGALQKKTLPLKLLVLGEFAGHAEQATFAKRQRYQVSQQNLDQVMAKLAPRISLRVDNKLNTEITANDADASNNSKQLDCDLAFNSRKDFTPENIVKQIPELSRLLAMRNLLKDLRAHSADNRQFRQVLQQVFVDSTQREILLDEILAHIAGKEV